MVKQKILIVEDEGVTLKMLTLELERAGYQVFQAENGTSGYQIAEAVRPDLIISDIVMPKMDGNQFRKALRASEFGKNIPFIVLTVRGQMQDYFEMMGVADFISKPFEMNDILLRVQKILGQPTKGS